ncbi:MAG: TetR/AcrR family transcriptional regulator [Myxococcota bacterium]
MDRRTRQRARTVDEIVDSAEALVLAADPAGFTVADIARGLGMTAGALYRYFPGRDAILARVQSRCLTSLGEALGAVPPGEPWGRLLGLAGAFVAWTRREPARYELLARMLADPRPLVDGDALSLVVPAGAAALAQVAAAWSDVGDPDPAARALSLFAAVHGAMQVDKLARFAPNAAGPGLARWNVERMLLGAGAPPEAIGAAAPWEVE